MRVLITGGAGFIGSHLCEHLAARGDSLVVLDDLSAGRRENLTAVLESGAARLEVGSVTDEARVAALVAEVDLVVHLAAGVGVRRLFERPVGTLEVNLRGTEVVLRAAAEARAAVFLASSSEVYGTSTRVPFREDDDVRLGPTESPRWAYAATKAADEWLALAWHRECGLPVVVGRFFNAVGPRQSGRYGMVLPTFAAQALRGEPLTVHGDGAQTRSFCHVHDTVRAVAELCASPQSPHVNGRVFNIGNDREISVRALAELVREVAGSDSEIVHVPFERAYGPGFEDVPRRVPDVSRLERAVGFRPQIPVEDAVADVVASLRERRAETAG